MTSKQKALLSQLSYLDLPDGKNTIGDLTDYYLNNPNKIPATGENLSFFKDVINAANKDPYLRELKIVKYTENKKTGFTAYALAPPSKEDPTAPSKDGAVVFRGSEDFTEIFKGNPDAIADWKNNAYAMLTKSSPQEIDAKNFVQNLDFDSIDFMGHSLGSYLATQTGLNDPRTNSITQFNGYGSLNFSKMLKNVLSPNSDKITGFRSSGDIASLTDRTFHQTTLAGNNTSFFDLFGGHGMKNIMEGLDNMDTEVNPFSTLIESIATLTGKNDELLPPLELETFAPVFDYISTFFSETFPGAIDIVTGKLTEFQEFWNEFWAPIGVAFSDCWDGIVLFFTETLPGTIEGVKEKWNDFKGFWSEFWAPIGENFSNCWDAIVAFFTETLPGTIAGVKEKWNGFKDFWSGIWESVKGFFSNAWDSIQSLASEKIPSMVSSIQGFFAELPGKMLEIGRNVVTGIFNGISNAAGWLYDQLRGWVGGVVDKIKGMFGIHSPSRLMRDSVGAPIAEGIAIGISENADAVKEAMDDIKGAVESTELEPNLSPKQLQLASIEKQLAPYGRLDLLLARAQRVMDERFYSIACFPAVSRVAAASAGNVYNNQSYNYTIQSNGCSPKATADAIKKQMTLQRMLFNN